MSMVSTASQTTALMAFALPSAPHSVRLARSYIRSALCDHGLSDYAEDAETITSELVTNAIEHANALKIGLELLQLEGSGAVAVVLTDPSPRPPLRRDPTADLEHGRGLNIVAALSARWGWRPHETGKAVFAILARDA
jgi:anti-sigma regulatory factor (Ser/Thr protein kinase)